MRRRDFLYDLPSALIAQQPAVQRSASRLLHLDRGCDECADGIFSALPTLLSAGDLLVVNDTQVIRARLFGYKPSGGRIELLIERILAARVAKAQVRASKPLAIGMTLELDGGMRCEVTARDDEGFYQLRFVEEVLQVLDATGHVPLPPYIERDDGKIDTERFQTLFADKPGAVAAPTAGLHFDRALIDELTQMGVEFARITLHVGAGTFQPMRADKLEDHHMHAERIEVNERTCASICATRRQGGRVVAVGTTVVRALETVAVNGEPQPRAAETQLFIKPGYDFQLVDAMITNFHLPESTLLVLVSAFAGRDRIFAAYKHAIERGYRFYSYGDAMLIT